MAFRIYNDTKEADDVYLTLEKTTDGNIALIGVNKGGAKYHAGNILSITQNGRLLLHDNCNVPGIQKNIEGRIKNEKL